MRDAYRGTTAIVLGLGVTGLAVARFLAAAGARVRAADRRPAAELGATLAALGESVEACTGGEDPAWLDGVDLVVPSPGVAAGAPLLRAAAARGIPIAGEIELAARHLAIPLLAVTGTNGKSTTTALLGEMLRAAGRRPFVGGNLGTPLVAAIGGDHDAAVVEVSSFQLEWVERFRPAIGVFLNLSEDHLDRYPDLEAYGRTKLRLLARQGADDVAVLNAGDPWIRAHVGGLAARRLWFAGGAAAAGGVPPAGGPSGGAAGERPAVTADAAAVRLRHDGREEAYALGAVGLAGVHNRENMMAAVAAARAFGVPAAAVQRALETFRGLPHRLELVRERGGVRWVDDSKGTNPGAVVRSLESYPRGVILLAGGLGKGGDYEVLVAPVRRAVKRAILFGAAREMLARTLAGTTEVEVVDSLGEAVARAARAARPGDTVLLSPACASFDMFRDYADRGRQFRALVEAL
jgi:UDP-N-acetylmuramoylalanine--D-glutamate ligase